jgi:hypothetical protein
MKRNGTLLAEMVTASGDDFEKAQDITDPAQRRARDQALRATFADAKSRHHEAIAEAELDIDYSSSPIVMGDKHDALSPGHRLPDTIKVTMSGGEGRLLHELAHRIDHTALLLGGSSVAGKDLSQLESAIRGANLNADGARFVEHAVAMATGSNDQSAIAKLESTAIDRLGIAQCTLLIVRPDGHVGLRADRDHLKALAAYNSLLASG